MKNLTYYITLASFLLLFEAQAQYKFNKVTKEDLTLESCDFYEGADAMVLGEHAKLTFRYTNDVGWQYVIDIERKIKIFTTAGKDYADIKIVTYDPVKGQSNEEIGPVKATTYNLVDGKIEKTKLKASEKFKNRLSDYRTETAFAMPNVQEGSVIEFKYSITSDFITNLYDWHFQKEIPVKFSEFEYLLPEFFNYQMSQVGNVIELQSESKTMDETFTYTYTPGVVSTSNERRTGSLPSMSKYTKLSASNVLPLIDEPFMNNRVNLPSRVEFQLVTVQMPGSSTQVIAKTYGDFNKTLTESLTFGQQIRKEGFAKEKVSTLQGDDLAKASAIVSWIQNATDFTNVYSTSSGHGGRKVLNDGKGSVGELNLATVAALRAAGLEADAVVLSTRGHGIPHPTYPSYEDFNYVVPVVKINGGWLFADATTNLPLGMLPQRCLNGKGWRVSENGGSWIDLKSKAVHSTTLQLKMNYTNDSISAEASAKFKSYAAIDEYRNINRNGEQDFAENLSGKLLGIETATFDKSDTDNGLSWNIKVARDLTDDDLYLDPVSLISDYMITTNPFKREERSSNIDFPYAITKRAIIIITMPEGFTAEIPEPAGVALPDKAGKFTYYISQSGNTISLNITFSLRKTEFTPADYVALKNFYQMISDKNSELIILSRG